MVKSRNKKTRVKHSSSSLNSVQAEGLKKVMLNMGGVVTYYFEYERIVFTDESPKGKTIVNSSVLQTSINKQCFFGESGQRLSPTQVYKMFQDTAWDLGATKFELD